MPHNKKNHKGPVTKMPQGAPAPMKNNGPRSHGGDQSFHHARPLQNQVHNPFNSGRSFHKVPVEKTPRFFSPTAQNPETLDQETHEARSLNVAKLAMGLNAVKQLNVLTVLSSIKP